MISEQCNYKAFIDYSRLKLELNNEYGIFVDKISLMSDFCASVYLLCTADKKYVFKLYRNYDTEIALQSADIIDYLLNHSFPVTPIICTKNGYATISLFFSEGNRTGILFDYIDGVIGYDLNYKSYAAKMGETIGLLHSLMEKYDKSIIQYGKEHYVGRYINLMKEFNYSHSKINELEEYGDILWNSIIKTKPGFCHGDLNPSNFIKTPNNEYILFDFDCAGIAYPINDIFTICNTICSFERFDIATYNEPAKKFLLLRHGYEKYRKLNEYDISAIYAFVGLNCYWITAQLDKYKSPLEGRQWLSKNYFNNQYDWLMCWKNLCKDNGLPF